MRRGEGAARAAPFANFGLTPKKPEYTALALGGAMPLRRVIGWSLAAFVAALFASQARDLWEGPLWVLEEPHPNHGAAYFLFFNESGAEIRLRSLSVPGAENPRVRFSPTCWAVPPSTGNRAGAAFPASRLAGTQHATVEFEVGGVPTTFGFGTVLVPLTQCDVVVRFEATGPTASPCLNHRPASDGGTWRH